MNKIFFFEIFIFQKDRFIFNVIADDNGKPFVQRSAVQVIVNVHEKQQSAPQWQTSDACETIVTIDEDIPVSEHAKYYLKNV